MVDPPSRVLDLISVSLNRKIDDVEAKLGQKMKDLDQLVHEALRCQDQALAEKISHLQLKNNRLPDEDRSSQLPDASNIPQQIEPQSRIQPSAKQEGIVGMQKSEDRISEMVEERFRTWEETHRNLVNAKFKNLQELVLDIKTQIRPLLDAKSERKETKETQHGENHQVDAQHSENHQVQQLSSLSGPSHFGLLTTLTRAPALEKWGSSVRYAATLRSVKQDVDSLLAKHKVFMVSKGFCPHCLRTKDALNSLGVEYEVLELQDEAGSPLYADVDEVQDYMKEKTGARSVPRVFIGGKFVGGADDTLAKAASGELLELLGAAGATVSKP